ncbi:hypothetical protein NLI96_g11196 [Meripilus lineatus]|uniref:Uncharacterized protein n=1 Tax=Meripilus lineatus TaxID=2056292 RepID=A0AAD5UTN2_9APHY|nr:hypothetical protein NLI96_g11196 [Physisporinus lineatus]
MSDSDSLPVAIRGLDQMNLVVMWLETLIYGINIVVFASVVYVLAFQRRRRGSTYKYLLAVTIFLFLLATIHVALSLRQLIEAFIGPPVLQPHGPIYYFLDQTRELSFVPQMLYATNVITQDLVVIWRLYVVWNSWKLAILPLAVEAGHALAVYFVVIRYYLGAPLDSVVVLRWGVAAWALDLIVNVVGTLAIASRLWWVGRKTASIKADKQNAYLGVAFIILESGAMFSTATFILVILFVNPPTIQAASAGINVVMQLATLSPLLIIVRVGLNITHGNSSSHPTPSNPEQGYTQGSKSNNASAPVRVLVSHAEQVDFPGERGKGTYEMDTIDSYNQRKKGPIADSDSV